MIFGRVALAPVACAIAIAACSAPRSPSVPLPAASAAPSGFTGSAACQPCHTKIYERWKKTPMANVVRDPRESPTAILPDLTTNTLSPFGINDVALVYGSRWKQRYFTKIGDDYYVEPVQWDIKNRVWRRYFVENNTDWWTAYYPPDNMKRPTGPLCDGCHSVDYDVKKKTVVEWNVGCERCHGPGAEHVNHPTITNIVNPTKHEGMANDACLQCHSQGRPTKNPIEGSYFDWPVGYQIGRTLKDYWTLEEHTLGTTNFTHYADGTAHKNRMQGNDFVQSVMYRHGVTCASCHDAHGTENQGQLRLPGNAMCLTCHGPGKQNGPRESTLREHTGHADGSAGSECIECHMPKIETTIADVRVRAHTFRFITPEQTDKDHIPNPCTTCHADKTTKWATDVLQKRAKAPALNTPTLP